jgi:hypothetical protein
MVVKAMWSKEVNKDTDIITEGEAADNFFVVEHGEFEVEKKGEVVASIGPWELVGELAIMYCFAFLCSLPLPAAELFHPLSLSSLPIITGCCLLTTSDFCVISLLTALPYHLWLLFTNSSLFYAGTNTTGARL